MKKILITLTCALGILFSANAQPNSNPFTMLQRLTDQQQERLNQLSQVYRCLVCQNESIAESQAALAQDLKWEIAQQIIDGKTDEEIKNYLVSRYGDFISYSPPTNRATFLLWLLPPCLLLLLLVYVLRQRLSPENKEDSND